MTERRVPTIQTLNDFVRAACFLRKETMGRETTAVFLQDNLPNSRVIYALDTGVVMANADPMTTGPLSDDGRNGDGYVFPGDENDTSAQIKLVAALSNFVCYELNPDDLMYQLPGHAEETARVYAAVAKKIEARGRPDYVKKSDREVAEVAKSLKRLSLDEDLVTKVQSLANRTETGASETESDNEVTAIIEHFVDNIVAAYQKFNRAEHEYLNYLRLLVRRGLTPLDDAARALTADPHSRALAYAFEAAELEKRTFGEVVRYNKLVTLWMARIGSLKSITSQKRHAHDAEALAILDLVNGRLEKLPWKTRMVLVTTDKHLVEAVSRRMEYGENESEGFGADYFRSFGRKYVQHLHAFLPECLVETDDTEEQPSVAETGSPTGRVVSWLDAFLGEKAGMTDFDPYAIARIAYDEDAADSIARKLWDQLGENGEAFEDILNQWHEIRAQASNRELFFEQLDQRASLADAVRSVVTEIIQNGSGHADSDPIDFLETTANKISENLWEAFVVSLSWPGARLLVADDSDRSRNPPDIRFDSLTRAGEIVRRLIDRNGYSSESDLSEALEKLKHDTIDEKPGNNALGYLYYLVMAAIFAKNSRWSVTYSLAQRAIAIVESHTRHNQTVKVREGSNISAREAYFVAATAKRLLARNWRDFELAASYLSSASEALEADHKKDTAKKQKGRRFRIEEIALNLSRFYWARHCWRETEGLDGEKEMVASLERAIAACYTVFEDIQALKDKHRDVRRSTNVNFATNVVQIAVARALLADAAPPADYLSENLLDQMRILIEKLTVVDVENGVSARPGAIPNRSYLIKIYLAASKILCGQSMSRREISLMFSEENMESHAVTQYDLDRFRELRDFCLAQVSTARA